MAHGTRMSCTLHTSLLLCIVVVLANMVASAQALQANNLLRGAQLRTGQISTSQDDSNRLGLDEPGLRVVMGGVTRAPGGVAGSTELTRKPASRKVPLLTVALLTLAMAAATGLGALPLFFMELRTHWAGICNGIASGVMTAASFDLIQEGQKYGGGSWVVLGILFGGLFILCCQKVLEGHEDMKIVDLKAVDARKVVLVVGIMTLHSFGEGSGVGVSFAGPNGLPQGLMVTLAIAVHNIPEGLAVSMVLASRGLSARKALIWSIFTSLPQPLVAVPAFLCAEAFHKLLPFCLGFAAGCMIWMVFAEVIPDSLKEANASHVGSAATASVAFMEVLSALLGSYDQTPKENGWALVASLLLVLGPFIGGAFSILLLSWVRMPPMFLPGLGSGAAFVVAAWSPAQLLLRGQSGVLRVIAWLCTGCVVFWVLEAIASCRRESRSGKREMLCSGPDKISPLARQALLVSSTVAFHAFVDGLVVGIASLKTSGLDMHMLLSASLHGLPRGATVAIIVYSATASWQFALLAATLTGCTGPVAAVLAVVAGIDYDGLDHWMILACGGLYSAFGGNLLQRALALDVKSSIFGVLVGSSLAVSCLSVARLIC